jgi:murein DD-endopeptidase MepM/ murein hydrolase activator NlpD|tara:strand:+ start:1979 stop:2185 length:207 start_codon:yes stop_codon:yes gene_type:complete
MMILIALAFSSLIYAENSEFLTKVKEQVSKGYTWEYVGYTETDGKNPSLIINEETNPHIYWQLRKPQK